MKFSFKIGNLECRSCNNSLVIKGRHTTAEIVQWHNNYCWTIAYWLEDKEGFYLHFVGSPPFEINVDPVEFMILAGKGQKKLDIHRIKRQKDDFSR